MDPFASILGTSGDARRIRAFGRRAAPHDAPVLLTGESGTGKGLVARAIHCASPRSRRDFVAVNCAGVPESLFESEFFGHARGAFTGANASRRGLFEQAHRGTLFLDEVGELPPARQAKLLTALEDGEVRRLGAEHTREIDVRVIAATGTDLEQAVAEGAFRRDLYHRLLVLSHRLPPLRERRGDLELLARHFLEQAREKYCRPVRDFAAAALERIRAHHWPGNVRELAHALEAAVLACEGRHIRARDLPATVTAPARLPRDPSHTPNGSANGRANVRYSFHGPPAEERRHIAQALRRHRGNKTRTAEALGMARNTLRSKLDTFDIDA